MHLRLTSISPFALVLALKSDFAAQGVSRGRFLYVLIVHDLNVNLSNLMVLHEFYMIFRLTSIGPFALVLALKSDFAAQA